MPGTNLSTTEKRLLEWWNTGYLAGDDFFPLREIHIDSPSASSGLRGIKHLSLELRYPLTVLCGKNGCGKTTLLSLTSLAYHSPAGYHSLGARIPREKRYARKSDKHYYTFDHFFCRGHNDPDPVNVVIKWVYSRHGNGNHMDTFEVKATKGVKKWMDYQRRPIGMVDYFGINRALPSAEERGLRTYFCPSKSGTEAQRLDPSFLKKLSKAFSKDYSQASLNTSHTAREEKRLRFCATDISSYSSYNMGAGEDIYTDLLLHIQKAKHGSLLVIEEIELGLHPTALKCLAEDLQQIMLEKHLQIICSTHSQAFLDAVPRQARILLKKDNEEHTVISSPTTRYAYSVISDESRPELVLYCEDNFARSLILEALRPDLVRRVEVYEIGSKEELSKVYRLHSKTRQGIRAAIIWDGDVTDLEISRYTQDDGEFVYRKLPGNMPPEKWALEKIQDEEGLTAFRAEIGDNKIADEVITNLKLLDNHHDYTHYLQSQLNYDTSEEAQRILVKSALRGASDELLSLRGYIESLLTG